MKKIIPGLVVCAMYLNECMADSVHVPEYVDKVSGVKCMAFSVDDAPFFQAISRLGDEEKFSNGTRLKATLEKMKEAKTADEMNDVASDLTSLSNALPLEQKKMLQDIFLNLFVRAALMGNVDAMFNLLSVSFNTPRERLSKIFTIEDIDLDLDFSELKEKLEAELDKSESPEAFKKVVCELKSHSAPASPIKDQLIVRGPSRPRSSSY